MVAQDGPTAPRLQAQKRLRVVFVDHVARLSGGEIALLRVLPELSRHVEATVILGEDGPLVDRLRAERISVEVLPLAPDLRDVRKDTLQPLGIRPSSLASLPSYVLRLRQRLAALEADIVHTNSLKSAVYGGLAGRLARIPVVWHVRDRISPDYLPRPAVQLVRVLAHILPSAVVANSRETLATLARGTHGRIVYNAVVPDAVHPVVRLHDSATASPVVGMIGRLSPWKGQRVFLDAFAGAFRGTDVRARIIGSAMFGENRYAASLAEHAEELGIAGQVEFRGFREDVWGELRALDLLVHCSVLPEPFGQVVLEGLAAGVPVIASAAGGPSELITNGVDGILTQPGDAEQLADAMQRLLADASLCKRLAAAGRARSRDFTPKRTAEGLLDIYNQVLERS
jgi:glycosyltransferase involved in cell wall biosynthesis